MRDHNATPTNIHSTHYNSLPTAPSRSHHDGLILTHTQHHAARGAHATRQTAPTQTPQDAAIARSTAAAPPRSGPRLRLRPSMPHCRSSAGGAQYKRPHVGYCLALFCQLLSPRVNTIPSVFLSRASSAIACSPLEKEFGLHFATLLRLAYITVYVSLVVLIVCTSTSGLSIVIPPISTLSLHCYSVLFVLLDVFSISQEFCLHRCTFPIVQLLPCLQLHIATYKPLSRSHLRLHILHL